MALVIHNSARTYPSSDISESIVAIQSQRKLYKVIVIGDSGVGKTTLTYRFCEGKFLNYTAEATIGVDFKSRTLELDGELVTLQLWDTAGQERYRRSMVQHYYRNAHAAVLVYDVTTPTSFDSLKRWITECRQNCYLDIPCILVGNKCDGVARVTTNVAQRFADQYNMPLFETSAKLDGQCDNVESIFMTLALKLKNHKKLAVPSLTAPSVRVTGARLEEPPQSSCSC